MIRTRYSRLVRSTSVSSPGIVGRKKSSTSTLETPPPIPLSKNHPTHLIFGANTDVGKTIVSTNLVQASIQKSDTVQYIKPLQCGGSDQGFLDKHLSHSNDKSVLKSWTGHTLFNWDTPASPHLASRLEDKPISETEILMSLTNKLAQVHSDHSESSIYIETAGGVLSPAPASPYNTRPRHAHGRDQGNTSWGWSTQADLYQPLRLPVVLVGDGRLGGISATLSALESLLTRGYDIHGILLLDESAHSSSVGSNISALREYASRAFKVRGGSGRALLDRVEESIVALPPVPPLEVPLHDWFQSQEVKEKTAQLDDTLKASWVNHVEEMEGMREKGKEVLWWPFTQHQGHNEGKVTATLMDGACGDYFSVLDQSDSGVLERMDKFDACASWWTQGVGHGESSIGLAAAAAAGKFGHVIFPDVVHEPATVLSDRLVNSPSGPGYGWASRVFFTDDGSTAMEVAIKMGMKKFCFDHGIEMSGKNNGTKKLTVCAQKDCYHGDTLGVMDVAEPSIFNEGQHPWYEPKGLFMAYPTIAYQQGSIALNFPSDYDGHTEGIRSSASTLDDFMNLDNRVEVDALYPFYMKQIEQVWDSYEEKNNDQLIGSVVIEPILLGAGGMKFIDPLWQRALMDVARSKAVPIVFDEVAAGLYRLGVRSCREILKADPDIASYAKLLTGGLLPMSVTLASEEVFNTFLGDSKGEALLHGHSYTAHPIGCVSAIHALETFETLFQKNKSVEDTNVPIMPYFDQNEVADLSTLPNVQESMSLGTVLAVTIKPKDGATGYGALSQSLPIVQDLYQNGVYARPLGNVVYIMVSPLTSRDECGRLLQTLRAAFVKNIQ